MLRTGLRFHGLLVFVAVASQARAGDDVPPPRPDHVVVVIEENKGFSQIIGNRDAPYINKLAEEGANFTQSYALVHPSQPNYIALFSGSTHGVGTNDCVPLIDAPCLGTQLLDAGLTFAG